MSETMYEQKLQERNEDLDFTYRELSTLPPQTNRASNPDGEGKTGEDNDLQAMPWERDLLEAIAGIEANLLAIQENLKLIKEDYQERYAEMIEGQEQKWGADKYEMPGFEETMDNLNNLSIRT